MPNPTLTFGFIIATLYGATFHLIFGGGARRLIFFIGAGWIGFAVGHISGVWFTLSIFNIGALHFFSATLGAIIALTITHTLIAEPSNTRSSR